MSSDHDEYAWEVNLLLVNELFKIEFVKNVVGKLTATISFSLFADATTTTVKR